MQAQALGAVAQDGPVTSNGVAGHLLVDVRSAAATLAFLERRSCVDADYTSIVSGRRHGQRAYVITEKGRAALAVAFPEGELS